MNQDALKEIYHLTLPTFKRYAEKKCIAMEYINEENSFPEKDPLGYSAPYAVCALGYSAPYEIIEMLICDVKGKPPTDEEFKAIVGHQHLLSHSREVRLWDCFYLLEDHFKEYDDVSFLKRLGLHCVDFAFKYDENIGFQVANYVKSWVKKIEESREVPSIDRNDREVATVKRVFKGVIFDLENRDVIKALEYLTDNRVALKKATHKLLPARKGQFWGYSYFCVLLWEIYADLWTTTLTEFCKSAGFTTKTFNQTKKKSEESLD